MLVRQVSAVTASGVLFGLAGLHAAWGAGSAWPFRSRPELADAVVGTAEVPTPAACFAVSGALAAAGVLVAGWPRSQPALRQIGVAGTVGVLAGRGALGLSGQTRLVSPASISETFSRLDRWVYSPLCLVLASASAPAAWPAKHTQSGP